MFFDKNNKVFTKDELPKKIKVWQEVEKEDVANPGKKITVLELVEIDNPDYVPFIEYTKEEVEDFANKLAMGYTLVVNPDGTAGLIPPTPPTEEELRKKYESKVDSLIREKYTLSQELSTIRQQANKPDEYAEYYAYCEQCKATAKAEIYGG